MKNLEKGFIIMKVLFSLFISYLVIFKGDAGSLVNAIGNFIVAGNYILGLIYTITILAIYPLLLHNLIFTRINLCSLKNKLLVFDIALILTNAIGSIFVSTKVYQMPLSDAQSKYGILTAGTAILFILSTIILLTILRNLDTEGLSSKELIYNKNPLSFTGKISRLPYFITKLLIMIFAIMLTAICNLTLNSTSRFDIVMCQSIVLPIIFLLALYAASKRLRDIKWSQWLLIIWAIPYVGLVIGIPLLFVKSKINDTLN